jgi:imidazole glycerol-phosphate synthase subunit HisH
MRIGIIDYEMGNLGSVVNACRYLGLAADIIARPEEVSSCDGIILPGVGAYGNCMEHLRGHGFAEIVRDWIAADRPFLGICLGLQVLFERSEESGGVAGLGIFPGTVRRFDLPRELKVPQMGWNRVHQHASGARMFTGVADASFFYFVHSYYVDTPDRALVAGETDYGIRYTTAIARGRVMAVQFHPEKSQSVGLKVLANFGALVEDSR